MRLGKLAVPLLLVLLMMAVFAGTARGDESTSGAEDASASPQTMPQAAPSAAPPPPQAAPKPSAAKPAIPRATPPAPPRGAAPRPAPIQGTKYWNWKPAVLPWVASITVLGIALAPWVRRTPAWQRFARNSPKSAKLASSRTNALATVSLLLCAVFAMGNYIFFEGKTGYFRFDSFFNAYEFYHYYIGSKYAAEVGYTNMYNATLVADDETGRKFKNRSNTIRNLATGRSGMKADVVLAERDKYKTLFTTERWEEFVTDIKWFKSLKQMPVDRWSGMLGDKGYNSTPVWSMVVGGLLANTFGPPSSDQMTFLALLDPLLIAVTTGCVVWAFGARAAMLMLILLGTHYAMHWWHMKGAFLRTDFAMCLVMTSCLVRKERYAAAGLLTGWAIVSRIFPVVFLFGIGAMFLWDLVAFFEKGGLKKNPEESQGKGKKIELPEWRRLQGYLRYFTAAGGLVVFLLLASVVYWQGLGLWKEYIWKIGFHNESISTWRMGFKYLFMASFSPQLGWGAPFGDWIPTCSSIWYDNHKTLWWSIQVCALLLALLAARHVKPYQAVLLGFVPCFFLASATYYYYIMLIVPILYFAEYPERLSHAGALTLMYLTGAAGYWFYSMEDAKGVAWKQNYATYYWTGLLIFVMVLWLLTLTLRTGRGKATSSIMLALTSGVGILLYAQWPLPAEPGIGLKYGPPLCAAVYAVALLALEYLEPRLEERVPPRWNAILAAVRENLLPSKSETAPTDL